ncbi:MAG: DUF6318 family protein [Propionibacteriales bacterium]|nr:DUF6318 family protein [Propionibacteriales bacterium]
MRQLRAVATALVAILALSACNGGDEPDDPKVSSTPPGTTSAPTTAPPAETPTEPALPKAATKATEAGARAFITYYWDLINYAQVTGAVKPLKAVSGPNCAGCNAGIEAIEDVYDADGHITNANYRARVTNLSDLDAEKSDIYAFKATVEVEHDDHEVVSADGAGEVFGASIRTYSAYVLWTKERWRLDVMESK